MRTRPSREIEFLSMSALDLFASALGVFILLAVLMLPYYQRRPSVAEPTNVGEDSRLTAAGVELAEARRRAVEAAAQRQAAEEELAVAQAELRRAEAVLKRTEEPISVAERALASAMDRLANLPQPAQAPAPAPVPVPAPTPTVASPVLASLDIVFVLDTTRSMRSVIADVKDSLRGIANVLAKLAPSLRIGFVAYCDKPPFATDCPYLVQTFPLRAMDRDGLQAIQAFVDRLAATGGGDTPEPVEEGLKEAFKMAWRPGVLGRIVLIGDAAARDEDWRECFQLADRFRASGRDRLVSSIYTKPRHLPAELDFYDRLAKAGAGFMVPHKGRIIESVLLSVIDPALARARTERTQ